MPVIINEVVIKMEVDTNSSVADTINVNSGSVENNLTDAELAAIVLEILKEKN